MFASVAARRVGAVSAFRGCNKAVVLRSVSSMTPMNKKKDEEKSSDNRRELHSTVGRQADAVAPPAAAEQATTTTDSTSGMMNRLQVTAEVTVSKIFPAGFGWQTASVIADNYGLAGDSLNFALATGMGDAIGVLAGHVGFYAAKKAAVDNTINMTKELHTGILLGSAAFCSGTAWQPIVNVLQGAELPFNQVFLGTWAGCGLAFYLGLRVGRTILSGPFEHIEEPTYENQKNDVSLSTAIGGATGFFVGTDAAYLPTQNWLINVVGIQDGTPDAVGSCIAGTSTAMGFLAAQTTLNTIYPAGKLWNDK